MSFPNKVYDEMRIKVFHFTVYDVARDEMVVPGKPGPSFQENA